MADIEHYQTTTPSVFQRFSSGSQNNSLVVLTKVLQTLDGIVSDEVEETVDEVLDQWIGAILSFFGIGANILNLIVFIRLGFKDTINISLTFITAWDLLKCLCFALTRMRGLIALVSAADAISWRTVTTIILGYVQSTAGFVSGLLAAYVSIERCLCTTMPFTVKFLLTKKVVILANLAISFVTTGLYVCVYIMYKFRYRFNPLFNQTIIVYTFEPQSHALRVYIAVISNAFAALSLVINGVCTWIISIQLKKSSKFRSSVSGDGNKGDTTTQLSSRDRQVIKMLLIIIIIYIICSMPRVAFFVPKLLVPGFTNNGQYHNILWVYVYGMNFFELLNASVNIFIYYNMSSQYKAAFQRMIRCAKSI